MQFILCSFTNREIGHFFEIFTIFYIGLGSDQNVQIYERAIQINFLMQILQIFCFLSATFVANVILFSRK